MPELCELTLFEKEKFLVLASDGIWQQMNNKEVIDIVWPFYLSNNAELAAQALVKDALHRWKENSEVVDDITCIVVFFRP